MNDNQKGLEFIDIITILSVIIQVVDHTLLIEQASNDDILKELKLGIAKIDDDVNSVKEMLSKIC